MLIKQPAPAVHAGPQSLPPLPWDGQAQGPLLPQNRLETTSCLTEIHLPDTALIELSSSDVTRFPEMKNPMHFSHRLFLNNLYEDEYAADKAKSGRDES